MGLQWERDGRYRRATSGQLDVGTVGQLDGDPTAWWYLVDAISLRYIAKARGHVKSEASAKRAVGRAWRRWLDLAGLQPARPPGG
jgi:hypothetical protein